MNPVTIKKPAAKVGRRSPSAPPTAQTLRIATEQEVVIQVPPAEILVIYNPRKMFNEATLKELAEAITAVGRITSPLRVRKLPVYTLEAPDLVTKTWRICVDGELQSFTDEKTARLRFDNFIAAQQGKKYELIFGERRKRAAELLKLPTVPVIVTDCDESTADIMRETENFQRENLDPIEAAEGQLYLAEKHGWTLDQLAEKIGKTGLGRSQIQNNLKLAKVVSQVKACVRSGTITASHGTRIARLPGAKLQLQCLEDCLNSKFPEILSVRQLDELIQTKYCLDLGKAPFDITANFPANPGEIENGLYMGPCSECPMRSGTNPENFPDIKNPNVCTSPACFAAKTDAHRRQQIAELERAGARILDAKASKGLFDKFGTLQSASGYVKTASFCYEDKKQRTYEEIFSPSKHALPLFVAQDPKGNLVKLYLQTDVESELPKIIKLPKTLPDRGGPLGRPEEETKPQREKRERDEQIQLETDRLIGFEICDAIENGEKQDPTKPLLSQRKAMIALIQSQYENYDGEVEKILERREINLALGPALQEMSLTELISFLVEMQFAPTTFSPHYNRTELDRFARTMEIDVAPIIQSVVERFEVGASEKPKAAPKAQKPKGRAPLSERAAVEADEGAAGHSPAYKHALKSAGISERHPRVVGLEEVAKLEYTKNEHDVIVDAAEVEIMMPASLRASAFIRLGSFDGKWYRGLDLHFKEAGYSSPPMVGCNGFESLRDAVCNAIQASLDWFENKEANKVVELIRNWWSSEVTQGTFTEPPAKLPDLQPGDIVVGKSGGRKMVFKAWANYEGETLMSLKLPKTDPEYKIKGREWSVAWPVDWVFLPGEHPEAVKAATTKP